MDKTELEWMLAAKGRIRGVVKTVPLRTFFGNTNCPGGTAWRSGFSYGWYRLEAPGSVVAASAVESGNLVRLFTKKSLIRRGSSKAEEGIGFRSGEWGHDPFLSPLTS